MISIPSIARGSRLGAGVVVAAAASLALAACGGGGGDTGTAGGEASGDAGGDKIAVTLITKTSTNPFFIAMQEGAKAAGEKNGVSITTAAGKSDGDTDTQVKAIEAAVARGTREFLSLPTGPAVNSAIDNARNADLYVIALDTPTDPPDVADITFATDNFAAGELIGKWAADQMDGKKATIALLDLNNKQIVTVDYNRDQGFLTGMGIDVKDKAKNGDEDKTGSTPAERAGTTRSSATSRPWALPIPARPPWRTACRRTRTSIWSIRSTSRRPVVPRRRSRRRSEGHDRVRRWRVRPRFEAGQGWHYRCHLPAVPGEDGGTGS